MSLNQQLADGIIDNRAGLNLLETGYLRDLDGDFDRYAKNVKETYRRGGNLDRLRTNFYRRMNKNYGGEFKSLIKQQGDFVTGNLEKGIGGWYKTTKPDASELTALVDKVDISGDGNLARSINKLSIREKTDASRIIRDGLKKGTATDDIASQLAGRTKISRKNARTVVRTSITRYSALAADRA